MKKITKYLIVIIILGVILGAGIPITYIYLFRNPLDPTDPTSPTDPPVSSGHVRIYVNSKI